MISKAQVIANIIIEWVLVNRYRLLVIGSIVSVMLYSSRLPYINIFGVWFEFIPYILTISIIIKLFKLSKSTIITIALLLFGINFIFGIAHIEVMTNLLSNISYFLIFIYIILSMRDETPNN